MIVSFGAASVRGSAATGDTVSERTVRFGSQAEQIIWLRRMVDQYRAVHAIRARARDIVFRQRGCEPKDKVGQALAIGAWVQDTITYVEEMPETFQTPTTTVAMGYGDCDDFSTLIASLLESIGIESELVGMEWDGHFRHIFPRAVVRGRTGPAVLIPLDATLSISIYEVTDPIRLAQERGDKVRIFVA